MTAVWTRLLVLGVVVAVAHGLTCRQCPIGILGQCLFPSEVTCDDSRPNCFSGMAQFSGSENFTLHNRGCLASNQCNQTVNCSILGVNVNAGFTCCQTDLCNGVTSAQLSLAAVCCAAMLASLWAS